MALPPDLTAGSTGEETADRSEKAADDGPLPLRGVSLVLAKGEEFTVGLLGSEVELTIQLDVQGRIRVFGLGTGDLIPMMNQHPGNFNVVLSKRRFGNKFDFFRLPREIREIIYSIIFRDTTYWRPLEDPLRTENFQYKRSLHPVGFLARLNKTAPSAGCGIAFINQQSLRETTLALFQSKRFHVCGDKQALSLLRSMGSYGRSIWKGPLVLNLDKWETNFNAAHRWIQMISRAQGAGGSMNGDFQGLHIIIGDNGWKTDKYPYIMSSPLGQIMEHTDQLQLGSVTFQPPLGSHLQHGSEIEPHQVFTIEYWNRKLVKFKPYMLDLVYKAMERAVKNKQASS